MNENDTNWFRPLWRRVAVTAVAGGLFALEVFGSRDPTWMTISGAILAYAVWSFFIAFERGEKKP